jgi:YD repeat-containing protein
MEPHKPSRRELLAGGLAGLFGWFWAGKSSAQVPPPPPPPVPLSLPLRPLDPLSRVTTYIYDSKGRLTGTIDQPFPRVTYTYDCGGRSSKR